MLSYVLEMQLVHLIIRVLLFILTYVSLEYLSILHWTHKHSPASEVFPYKTLE